MKLQALPSFVHCMTIINCHVESHGPSIWTYGRVCVAGTGDRWLVDDAIVIFRTVTELLNIDEDAFQVCYRCTQVLTPLKPPSAAAEARSMTSAEARASMDFILRECLCWCIVENYSSEQGSSLEKPQPSVYISRGLTILGTRETTICKPQ